MASEIRVDKINSLSGVGTVTLSPTGVDIAGITTASTLKATTGIVTTLTATTGIVTTLTANTVTSLGAVSGTTGTYSDDVTVTGSNKKFITNSSSSGDYIRLYAAGGTGKWDIYGNGANLRIGNNDSGGIFQVDHSVQFGDGGGFDMNINGTRHQFSIGGSEKMRITSDGALGIGTTSPDGRLHLVTGSTTDDAHVTFHASATSGTNNTGEVLKVISSRGTGNTNPIFNVLTNTSTSVLVATGDQKVGIGTTSPDKTLEIRQTSAGHDILAINRPNSNTAALTLGNDSSNNGVIASNNSDIRFGRDLSDTFTQRMRLTNDGILRIGGTHSLGLGTDGTLIPGVGIMKVSRDTGSGAAVAMFFGGSGKVYILGDGDLENSNNRYTGFSDQRLKENIVDANSQWDDIKALKVRNYNFKESTGFNTHKQIGVIAQELEASGMNGLVKDIADELYVEGDELPEGKNIGDVKEEGHKSVAYSVLYMKAIKALQEAMAKIETLETKVAALEAA